MSGHLLRRLRPAVWPTTAAVALVAMLAVGASDPAPAAPASPRGASTAPLVRALHQVILVLGDSVAYDTVRGGWVTRLGALLAASYPRALPSGERSGQRWEHGPAPGDPAPPAAAQQRVRPALVIVAYGLND